MKFPPTKIKLKSSKYRKKFHLLKVECKFDFYHVIIPSDTVTLLKYYFHQYGEIFLDKIIFKKCIRKYKRLIDHCYVMDMKKRYRDRSTYIKNDILNYIVSDDITNSYGDLTYLYIPFKNKSEYLKFKLKYTK